MNRGWFCIWRKVEDNISWSRGAEYRGLMITILQKANWKEGFFLGHKIMPGQFPTSAENLGKDLKISRQKCQRALAQLARDNFIKVENMGNRFTLITVTNWDTYQEKKDSSEQQVGNQRATGEQQVGTIKQGNKETKKEYPPCGVLDIDLEKIIADSGTIEMVSNYQAYVSEQKPRAPHVTYLMLTGGSEAVQQLITADGYNLDEIRKALMWALHDDFWSNQVLSLEGIRHKSPNGLSKFANLYNVFEASSLSPDKPKLKSNAEAMAEMFAGKKCLND